MEPNNKLEKYYSKYKKYKNFYKNIKGGTDTTVHKNAAEAWRGRKGRKKELTIRDRSGSANLEAYGERALVRGRIIETDRDRIMENDRARAMEMARIRERVMNMNRATRGVRKNPPPTLKSRSLVANQKRGEVSSSSTPTRERHQPLTVRDVYLNSICETGQTFCRPLSPEKLDEYYRIIIGYIDPRFIPPERECCIAGYIMVKLNKIYKINQKLIYPTISSKHHRITNRELEYITKNPEEGNIVNYWNSSDIANQYSNSQIPKLELLYDLMAKKEKVIFKYDNKPIDIIFELLDKKKSPDEITLESFFFHDKEVPDNLKYEAINLDPDKNWTCNLLTLILNWFDQHSSFNKVTLMDASSFNRKKCKPYTIIYLLARNFAPMYQCANFRANPPIDIPFIQTLLDLDFRDFINIPPNDTKLKMKWL